jgi:hypothetical protein
MSVCHSSSCSSSPHVCMPPASVCHVPFCAPLTRIYIPHVSVPHVFLCFFHISRLQALQRSPNPADRLKTAFDVVTDLYNQGGLRMFWQVGGCHMFLEQRGHRSVQPGRTAHVLAGGWLSYVCGKWNTCDVHMYILMHTFIYVYTHKCIHTYTQQMQTHTNHAHTTNTRRTNTHKNTQKHTKLSQGVVPAIVMVSNPTIQYILYEWLTTRLVNIRRLAAPSKRCVLAGNYERKHMCRGRHSP